MSDELRAREIIAHVDTTYGLPITLQTELLGVSRSSFYYQPRPVSVEDTMLMNKIDELNTKRPYYGSRRIADELDINRKHAQRLMRIMGIEAIYPKKNLRRNNKSHPIYPYLLRNMTIERVNQVWGADITYIRMQKGFVYLMALLDWFSRFVVGWRLSTTLETEFCVAAAAEALQIGIPEISNTDQGVQFTDPKYTTIWESNNVKVSMDGRGRWMDNVFTERLWRSVKYEEVYLKSYETVADAKQNLTEYFNFYNFERRHQSLHKKTPAEVFFNGNH